ncbi:zinc finger SWIM domain-containing protein 7 isoform 1-T1 [Anomaloglossus baeobatrachus]|uniref:zinc finger SWIM domain-containing protein 7 isoform X1 n=2 Tax=Anomaloglossus baeobatrachus TaxID=238106 RepID=UPI003F4F851B
MGLSRLRECQCACHRGRVPLCPGLQPAAFSASGDVPGDSCSDDMDLTLPSAAEELLREIKRRYQETSQISDEHLLGLKFIFGPTALYALDLVDQRSVTHLTSPSGRSTFQVTGSSGKMYTCYKASHYCSCPAFSFSVLRRQDSLMCKHILAVYLSQAIRCCQGLSVSDKQMSEILLAKED